MAEGGAAKGGVAHGGTARPWPGSADVGVAAVQEIHRLPWGGGAGQGLLPRDGGAGEGLRLG